MDLYQHDIVAKTNGATGSDTVHKLEALRPAVLTNSVRYRCPSTDSSHYIEARKRGDIRDGFTLLRLGPYTQTRHAQQDYDRITAALDGQETTLIPGYRIPARYVPFDASDYQLFTEPHEADAVALLAATVEGVSG